MKFTILTLFPEMFEGIFDYSIIKRAQNSGIIEIDYVDLREFGIGSHKQVDDKPYGGGVGMVLRVDVLVNAIESIKEKNNDAFFILLDPKGERFSQESAENLSHKSNIVLICGHYEGFDARIKKYIDMEISLGDFVLTGGEIPAAAVVDAVTRQIPGVLKDEAIKNESFSQKRERKIEHPHYTRPRTFRGDSVPNELLTGDPKIVDKFRNSKKIN